jgi:preprotein translocase subunit SecE
MARNRKRRNTRPARPQSNGSPPAQAGGSSVNGDGLPAASTEEAEARVPASVGASTNGHEPANADPGADRADAQVALGRPELADVAEPEELESFEEPETTRESRRAEVTTHQRGRVETPGGLVSRFVGFLRGCWLELQRVQWPDRKQVMQATGVVVGFVIVAGVFLGVADLVSSKLVHLIIQ